MVSGRVFEGEMQHQRKQQGPKRVPLSHSITAKHWRLVRVCPRNPELAEIPIQVPGISGKRRACPGFVLLTWTCTVKSTCGTISEHHHLQQHRRMQSSSQCVRAVWPNLARGRTLTNLQC